VQAAVDAAHSGDTIKIAGVCKGPVAVVDRHDLTIEGVAPTSYGCPSKGLGPQDLESTIRGGWDDDAVIKVTRSTNVTVRFLNIVDGKSEGVEQKNSRDGHTVCNCVARNEEGIEIHGGKGHEVAYNLVFGNDGNGIRLRSGSEPSRWNTVRRNVVEGNGGNGIVSEDTRDNTITDNVSRRNGGSGILLDDADDHQVTDNDTAGNRVCGITLRQAEDDFVDDNRDDGEAPEASPACCESGDDNTGNNVTRACR
jgi:parallel beta-helix repeat protein